MNATTIETTAWRRFVTILLALLMALTMTVAASTEAEAAEFASKSVENTTAASGTIYGYKSWSGKVGVGVEKKLPNFKAWNGDDLVALVKDCGDTAVESTTFLVRLNEVTTFGNHKTVRTRRLSCDQKWTLAEITNNTNPTWYQFTVTNEGPTIRGRSLFLRFQRWAEDN